MSLASKENHKRSGPHILSKRLCTPDRIGNAYRILQDHVVPNTCPPFLDMPWHAPCVFVGPGQNALGSRPRHHGNREPGRFWQVGSPSINVCAAKICVEPGAWMRMAFQLGFNTCSSLTNMFSTLWNVVDWHIWTCSKINWNMLKLSKRPRCNAAHAKATKWATPGSCQWSDAIRFCSQCAWTSDKQRYTNHKTNDTNFKPPRKKYI